VWLTCSGDEADLVGSPRPFFTLTEQWGLLGGLVGLVAWRCVGNIVFQTERQKKQAKNKKQHNKHFCTQKEGVVVELSFLFGSHCETCRSDLCPTQPFPEYM